MSHEEKSQIFLYGCFMRRVTESKKEVPSPIGQFETRKMQAIRREGSSRENPTGVEYSLAKYHADEGIWLYHLIA